MAYGRSNDDVIDDVTWPSKVKVVIPISLRPVISKTARDRDLVLMAGAPSPSPTLYKSCKKVTWWIYALSECLLVLLQFLVTVTLQAECSDILSQTIGFYCSTSRFRRECPMHGVSEMMETYCRHQSVMKPTKNSAPSAAPPHSPAFQRVCWMDRDQYVLCWTPLRSGCTNLS